MGDKGTCHRKERLHAAEGQQLSKKVCQVPKDPGFNCQNVTDHSWGRTPTLAKNLRVQRPLGRCRTGLEKPMVRRREVTQTSTELSRPCTECLSFPSVSGQPPPLCMKWKITWISFSNYGFRGIPHPLHRSLTSRKPATSPSSSLPLNSALPYFAS